MCDVATQQLLCAPAELVVQVLRLLQMGLRSTDAEAAALALRAVAGLAEHRGDAAGTDAGRGGGVDRVLGWREGGGECVKNDGGQG